MAESNPRIVVPPEVTAAGPTPSPSNRTVGAPERGPVVPLPIIALVTLALIGSFIFLLNREDTNVTAEGQELVDSTTSLSVPTTEDLAASASSSASTVTTDAVPATTTPVEVTPTTAAPTTTETTATTTPAPELVGPPLRETGTVRHAVFSGGTLYLRGAVPSTEFGAQIVAAAETVVGEGNVINQYQIDPTAAAADSAPLYVADTVLFLPSQAGINPQFFPILDLGTRLLAVNENVRLEVLAHTDDIGSDALNARLSQIRAETVRQYWLDQGADPDRITATGRGEAEPIADNSTAAGRQANRRAEFIVTGILG